MLETKTKRYSFLTHSVYTIDRSMDLGGFVRGSAGQKSLTRSKGGRSGTNSPEAEAFSLNYKLILVF